LKLYKFYKDDCVPCRSLSKLLSEIHIPENLEIVNINIKENMDFTIQNKITGVPTLMYENGNKLIGLKPKEELLSFINGIS
jgi:hypothetical protein